MTKKHFEAIAAVMARASNITKLDDRFNLGLGMCWSQIAVELASMCAQFNPAFDRDRFLRACRGD